MRNRTFFVAGIVLSGFVTTSPAAQSWQLLWSDEFEGAGLPDASKWSFQVGGGGWGNAELEYYTDKRTENVRRESGNLVIEARKESWGSNNYTSGRIRTAGKGDWKYGRVEVRAKLPTGRGMWPAIWMLPTENVYGGWPKSGELDIMENVGYDPDRVHSNIHCESFNGMNGTNKGASRVVAAPYDVYHTYRMDWFADRVEYYVDDVILFTYKNDGSGAAHWPYDQKFHLILNIAIGGGWGGQKGVDDAVFPQKMYVDWVRVYQAQTSGVAVHGSAGAGNRGFAYDIRDPDGRRILSGTSTGRPTRQELSVLLGNAARGARDGIAIVSVRPDSGAAETFALLDPAR
jgi:beta-glucanase (GH16 family)